MICTWAPGKKGRWSASGTSSSHGGTIARRAVPLRMEILPFQWSRKRLMPASPWPRPGIAEAAHALDQRRLERRAVAPALAEALGVGAFERPAEADARIAHRDHHDAAAEPTPEGIRLHRHPATGAGVLHNILARLGKRHTEAHRRLRLQSELAVQDARRPLAEIFSTTWCTSSVARTGVTSSSTSDGPVPPPWAPCRGARTARRRAGRTRPCAQ